MTPILFIAFQTIKNHFIKNDVGSTVLAQRQELSLICHCHYYFLKLKKCRYLQIH